MAEDWPRDPQAVAQLVAERRRQQERFASFAECAVCDRGGPWIGVDSLTGWITCPSCTADLARYSRGLERHGNTRVHG